VVASSVELTPAAAKKIRRLSKDIQKRVLQRIRYLEDDPRPPGCEPVENFKGSFKVREGDYRAVYTIRDEQRLVLVAKVAHSSEVYKRLEPLKKLMPVRKGKPEE
jgi:mRNA interferase RelE/StbE